MRNVVLWPVSVIAFIPPASVQEMLSMNHSDFGGGVERSSEQRILIHELHLIWKVWGNPRAVIHCLC